MQSWTIRILEEGVYDLIKEKSARETIVIHTYRFPFFPLRTYKTTTEGLQQSSL